MVAIQTHPQGGTSCSLPVIPGTIAVSEDGPEKEIKVLRDTGAEQSLLQVGWLPLPSPARGKSQRAAVNVRGGRGTFSPEGDIPANQSGGRHGDSGNG